MEEKEKNHIILAQKGDMRAFEQLIYKYDKHVLNIAYKFRYNNEDSKDIYQEVFLRVFKGLKNFQFNSEFSTWLFRITTNVCLTFKTNQTKNTHTSIDQSISVEDDSITLTDYLQATDRTDEFTEKNEMKKNINRCLNKMPHKQKLAFTLKYFDEYKIREIAEIMSCNEGTIKRYIFNASEKLRTELKSIYKH